MDHRRWIKETFGVGAFAVRYAGDSMRVHYQTGDLLYIHPTKPAVQGRNVLVEFKDRSVIVKGFVSQSDTELVLRQDNPEQELRFPLEDVLNIYRVVGSFEDEDSMTVAPTCR